MKILAIDYGMRRIGLATTDASGILPSPYMTIENRGYKKNVTAIGQIIAEQDVGHVVIGLPRYPDGRDSAMTLEVQGFGKELALATEIKIDYHDEVYTSKQAEDHIRENLGITRPAKIKELVDKMAAFMLLYNYLEENKS